jgi:hypothetical protein
MFTSRSSFEHGNKIKPNQTSIKFVIPNELAPLGLKYILAKLLSWLLSETFFFLLSRMF